MDPGEVTEGRCGLDSRTVCCWRETWNDADQCIWHTDEDEKPVDKLAEARSTEKERLDGAYLAGVQAEDTLYFSGCSLRGGDLTSGDFPIVGLSEADLTDADLSEANLFMADLSEANLTGADLSEANLFMADLSGANLFDADLSKADFREADLSKADLRSADLKSTDLNQATLEGTDLEDALLVRTNLRGANLENAQLYQTYFSDVQINSDTDFGDTCIYENPDKLNDDWNIRWDAAPTEAAVWTYRRLQDLHEKYALTEDARDYHIKKEEAERKRHKKEIDWRQVLDADNQKHLKQWAIYAINGWLSRHGERPWRVVRISLYVVVFWSLLYLLSGIRVPDDFSGTKTVGFELLSMIPVPEPFGGALVTALDWITTSIYFSVVTFTTLGYGDFQPATGFAQALATVESFLGALLMAYLVFVLGRRTNW